MSEKIIREYVDDYIKYYPEKWRWSLKEECSKRYLQTRARRSKGSYGTNNEFAT